MKKNLTYWINEEYRQQHPLFSKGVDIANASINTVHILSRVTFFTGRTEFFHLVLLLIFYIVFAASMRFIGSTEYMQTFFSNLDAFHIFGTMHKNGFAQASYYHLIRYLGILLLFYGVLKMIYSIANRLKSAKYGQNTVYRYFSIPKMTFMGILLYLSMLMMGMGSYAVASVINKNYSSGKMINAGKKVHVFLTECSPMFWLYMDLDEKIYPGTMSIMNECRKER